MTDSQLLKVPSAQLPPLMATELLIKGGIPFRGLACIHLFRRWQEARLKDVQVNAYSHVGLSVILGDESFSEDYLIRY